MTVQSKLRKRLLSEWCYVRDLRDDEHLWADGGWLRHMVSALAIQVWEDWGGGFVFHVKDLVGMARMVLWRHGKGRQVTVVRDPISVGRKLASWTRRDRCILAFARSGTRRAVQSDGHVAAAGIAFPAQFWEDLALAANVEVVQADAEADCELIARTRAGAGVMLGSDADILAAGGSLLIGTKVYQVKDEFRPIAMSLLIMSDYTNIISCGAGTFSNVIDALLEDAEVQDVDTNDKRCASVLAKVLYKLLVGHKVPEIEIANQENRHRVAYKGKLAELAIEETFTHYMSACWGVTSPFAIIRGSFEPVAIEIPPGSSTFSVKMINGNFRVVPVSARQLARSNVVDQSVRVVGTANAGSLRRQRAQRIVRLILKGGGRGGDDDGNLLSKLEQLSVRLEPCVLGYMRLSYRRFLKKLRKLCKLIYRHIANGHQLDVDAETAARLVRIATCASSYNITQLGFSLALLVSTATNTATTSSIPTSTIRDLLAMLDGASSYKLVTVAVAVREALPDMPKVRSMICVLSTQANPRMQRKLRAPHEYEQEEVRWISFGARSFFLTVSTAFAAAAAAQQGRGGAGAPAGEGG